MRGLALLAALLFCLLFAPDAFGQGSNGVCQMRTPIRSTIKAIRPANWKVFNAPAPVASCSGVSAAPVPVATTAPAPVVAEIVSYDPAPVATASVEAAGVVSERIAFRRALKAATRSQVAAGNITPGQALLLNGLTFFPAKCDAVMAAVHDAAIEEGLATATQIDWDGLANFIERILPIILQLIQLFG